MIFDLLEERAGHDGDRPFLITDDGIHTFARTQMLARKLATVLSRKIAPGDHVALISGNSAAYVVTFLAINFAGGVAVCLNNGLVADSINYQIEQSDAKLLIVDEDWEQRNAGQLTSGILALPRIVIGDEIAFFAELDSELPIGTPCRDPAGAVAILYTSGTTGLPKGVICTETSYLASGRAMAELLELGHRDRTMVFMPLFHTNPQIYAMMSALHAGSALIIRKRFSATSFFDDAVRFQATGFTFVGSILAILAAKYPERMDRHQLRFCVGGGTNMDLASDVELRFGFKVHELYGMTEIGGWISGSKAQDIRPGSNGRIRDDIEVMIADEFDGPAAIGERGEILVRSKRPNLILAGYYNKEKQYVSSIRNLWFHTGDIGSVTADGHLYFHGRRGDVIRRGGEMIAPDALEAKLGQMEGIADCAIVGVPDAIMGMEIKAVVVAAKNVTGEQIRQHLAAHFPRYMLPRYLEFVPEIPRTETAKIKRTELKSLGDHVIDLAA